MLHNPKINRGPLIMENGKDKEESVKKGELEEDLYVMRREESLKETDII